LGLYVHFDLSCFVAFELGQEHFAKALMVLEVEHFKESKLPSFLIILFDFLYRYQGLQLWQLFPTSSEHPYVVYCAIIIDL
jgi:hypothetical protein